MALEEAIKQGLNREPIANAKEAVDAWAVLYKELNTQANSRNFIGVAFSEEVNSPALH